jgi:sec-independent protein translocase protein TatA
MGPIGVPEMIAIFVIALLLFGPKKLPELGRTLGKAITEFRRASSELKATFESHLSELDRENQSLKQSLNSYMNDTHSSPSYSYDNNSHYDSEYQHSSSSSESTTSPSTIASATAIEEGSANREEHTAASHVEGTVARSAGSPADSTRVPTEDTHSA